MSKLWKKNNVKLNSIVEKYTVGKDNLIDQNYFFPYDIEGTSAHIKALELSGQISNIETDLLLKELSNISIVTGKQIILIY